jgi:hypothetical protein
MKFKANIRLPKTTTMMLGLIVLGAFAGTIATSASIKQFALGFMAAQPSRPD